MKKRIEVYLEKTLPLFSFVTPAKFKSITVEQIAKAMVATAKAHPASSATYHYPEMMDLIRRAGEDLSGESHAVPFKGRRRDRRIEVERAAVIGDRRRFLGKIEDEASERLICGRS